MATKIEGLLSTVLAAVEAVLFVTAFANPAFVREKWLRQREKSYKANASKYT